MTNSELKSHFEMCEAWQDADQWESLATAYFARGYVLNAAVCFKRADECRGIG